MITSETRRESYDTILETLGKRQQEVYNHLKECGSCTAGELSWFMFQKGVIPKPERNFCHPRLNEMVEMGWVEIVGKKQCGVSGKRCAIYRALEKPSEEPQLSFEL